MTNVWVVTGSSTGLGKSICLSALNRGHKVIATCRGDAQARLSDLVAKGAYALSLDVTAAPEELEEFARKAIQVYGHVDVLCNNAGYVQFGAFEELRPEEIMKQYSTLVFGPLNLSRVFLSHMRERRTGCIGNIGSRGSQMNIPGVGAYTSAKAALAALSQTLAAEVKSFGIRVVCIEPGDFRTDVFTQPIMAHRALKEYTHVTAPIINHLREREREYQLECLKRWARLWCTVTT